jgi:hypothetical protein
MSKRRKNAGEGYGYMFHGSFSKKADAVAKERKTKGAWVKSTPTNQGYRYIVMSPRTNPIKRKKKNPRPFIGPDGKVWTSGVRRKREPSMYVVERGGRAISQIFTRIGNARKAAKQLGGKMVKVRPGDIAAGGAMTGGQQVNPSELLVMGANPHSHEITAKPGETITIRVNPTALSQSTDDSRFMLAAAAQLFPGKALGALTARELSQIAMLAARLKRGENPYFGFGPSSPSRKELAASRREFRASVRRKTKEERAELSRLRRSARSGFRGKRKLQDLFHEVYGANPGASICGAKIGGEVCTRKPGHRGPHLPQGATMRTRARLPHNWKPRTNPSAAALREAFTGADADSYTVHREDHMPAGDYAQLGKLLALYVKPHFGGQVQMIKPRGTILVADESARQLWFVGGDQDISSALSVFGAVDRGSGLFELGEARRIDYKQRKEHVPDPDVDEWRHEFGEETGERPLVLFDATRKRLLLEGGEYVVRAEGIVN